MSKYDIKSILGDVQKLYAKDKKATAMLTTGDSIKQAYTEDDGIPIPESHPLRHLTQLPCIPFDKIIQFSGEPDCGKSTCLGELVAAAQKAGFIVIYLDSEDKVDAHRLETQFGAKPDEMMVVKTNEILQGGEKVRKLILATKEKYPAAKIAFFWDSVGGSQSRSHAERELDSEKHSQPGQDAKENGSVMKMLVGLINKFPQSITVVLANQVYAKIGFMQHGNKESGGKKIEFHSSLIIQLRRVKKLTKIVKKVKMKYGIITCATVSKNHLSQSETSVDSMNFEITAKGSRLSEESVQEDEDS